MISSRTIRGAALFTIAIAAAGVASSSNELTITEPAAIQADSSRDQAVDSQQVLSKINDDAHGLAINANHAPLSIVVNRDGMIDLSASSQSIQPASLLTLASYQPLVDFEHFTRPNIKLSDAKPTEDSGSVDPTAMALIGIGCMGMVRSNRGKKNKKAQKHSPGFEEWMQAKGFDPSGLKEVRKSR